MKIQIGKNGKDITLRLPTGLILNRFVIHKALEKAGGEEAGLSREDTARLLDEISRIREKQGSWLLVEVDSADGEHVEVVL